MKHLCIILLFLLIVSCKHQKKETQSVEQDSIVTVEKILAQKPKFPGYFPTSYVLTQDTHLKIVCNRNIMEKVWMVYYDSKVTKWQTLTWIGQGEDNKIIGDTILYAGFGLKGGSSSDDAPEFYIATSDDKGKTWKPQHNYQAYYHCKDHTGRSFYNGVLVSNDYINPSGRPAATIIIQQKKEFSYSASGMEQNIKLDFLCPVTEKFDLK